MTDLSPHPVIYAAVIPSGISGWTEIKASAREGFDPNGYPSTKYIRADLAALEYKRGRQSVLDAITYTTPDGAIHNSFYDYVDLREKLQ